MATLCAWADTWVNNTHMLRDKVGVCCLKLTMIFFLSFGGGGQYWGIGLKSLYLLGRYCIIWAMACLSAFGLFFR
jgi:hypothetical protein